MEKGFYLCFRNWRRQSARIQSLWAAEKILELVLSSTSTCIGVYFTRSQPSGEIPNSWRPAKKGVEVGQRCWHSQSELGTARLPRRGQECSLCGKYPQLPRSTNLPFDFSTKPRGLQLASKVGRARQLGLRTGHPPCTAHTAGVLPPQGPVISLLGAAGAPSAARHARSVPRSSRGLASTLVQVRERAGPGAHRQARAWPLSAGGSGTPRVDSTPLAGGGQGLGGCCPGAAPTPLNRVASLWLSQRRH